MGGTNGPRKRVRDLAYDTREPLLLPFVGGPYDGTERVVDSDRYYVLMYEPSSVIDLMFPVQGDQIATTPVLVKEGVYERGLNYKRKMVMRWLGWSDDRTYERTVIDNESPDYHG